MRLVSFRPLARRSTRPDRPRLAAAIAAALALLVGTAPAVATADPPPARDRPAPNALDTWFAALAAAPDDLAAARLRGRIEAAWKTAGGATAGLLSTRAVIAAHAGDRGLALDLLDAAIVVAPNWADARHQRALIRFAGGDAGRAAVDLAEALRLEPRHLGAIAGLAAVSEATGRKAEALNWLRRLATLDPRNPGLGGRIERLSIEVEGRDL